VVAVGSYTVAHGEIGAHAKTLVATIVDTVTFELGEQGTPGWARVPRRIEVLTDGTDDIYVTVDGSAPTIGGANCWRVPAAAGSSVIDVADDDPEDAVVVKLVSAGTPEYSVSRA
jgi:hypothetical protein